MVRKRPLVIALTSIVVSLLTLLAGKNTSKFGYPVKFLFYKGGHGETIDHAYEMMLWDNLKHGLFRMDYFIINFLVFYIAITLIMKGVEKIRGKLL